MRSWIRVILESLAIVGKPGHDECEKCGRVEEGKYLLMFYRWYETFPKPPVQYQFFCRRCLWLMRIYAWIGMSIFFLIFLAGLATYIWAKLSVPPGS